MITGLAIEGLRGIGKAELAGLAPLTVLVGPSGAGKSTLLDALLIATSASPGDAIGRTVRRRPELFGGVDWLFRHQGLRATIATSGDPAVARRCTLARSAAPSPGLVADLPPAEQARRPAEIVCDFSCAAGSFRSRTVISTANVYAFDLDPRPSRDALAKLRERPPVRLVESSPGANHEPLHRAWTRAVEEGRSGVVEALVRDMLPGAVGLRVLAVEDEPHDRPILHVDFDTHTVPVAAIGSGLFGLVRLAIDLGALAGGLALVEEPEAHQHPAAIWETGRLLVEANRRGIQIVVSTHSSELIDAITAASTDDDLPRLAVIRVALFDGELRSSRFDGPMVRTARDRLHEDLR